MATKKYLGADGIAKLKELIDADYLAKNQGSENVGKVLGIGNDGNVTPVTGSSGGGTAADTTLAPIEDMSADNVQDGIEELKENIDDTESRLSGSITDISAKAIKQLNHRVTTNTDIYYDADDVPAGAVVAYGGVGTHVPDVMGTLICYEGTSINDKVQLYVAITGKMFHRIRHNTWGAWRDIDSDLTTSGVLRVKGVAGLGRISNTSTYSSADDILANSIYLVTVALSGMPSELSGYGVLITLNSEDTSQITNGHIQIFINEYGRVATRIRWSSAWRGWNIVPNSADINALIDAKMPDIYCSFSLFENIGVVGDSYASGASGETASATAAVDHISISWPQILARRNGVNVTSYTKGGLSTRSWLTDTSVGLSKLLSEPAKDLYILALERNDYNAENGGETGYIGDITDITSHSLGSYPDTFYGNYATIIENIISHAPNAKIVMMTGDYVATNVLGTAYNNAVKAIAEHYNLPCMVQLDDPFFNSNYYRQDWAAGGHPSAIIYSGMELAIERMFAKCVSENKSYFTYFIPSNIQEDN